jgi:uncharacterized repeat protein (TIGR02543 family)
MKKKVAIGLIALLSVSFVFFGCGSSDGDPTGSTTYTVTFDSNGGSPVKEISGVAPGATIQAPVSPTQSGYEFVYWYKEKALTNVWKFGTDVVEADITLYAGWKSLAGELANNPALVGNATVSGTTVTLTGNVTLPANLSIPAGVTLVVPNSTSLTVAGTINNTGTIEVTGTGTYILNNNVTGTNNGTVIIGPDAIVRNGTGVNLTGSGTNIVKGGGTVYFNGESAPFIGATSDSSAKFQVASGATFTYDNNLFSIADGEVTFNGGTSDLLDATNVPLVIKANGTLIIPASKTLRLKNGGGSNDQTVTGTAATAQIEIESGGTLQLEDAVSNFYANGGTLIGSGSLITVTAGKTYAWDASLNSNNGGWRATTP